MIRIADIISGSSGDDKEKEKKKEEPLKDVSPPANIELVKGQPEDSSFLEQIEQETPLQHKPSLMELSKSMLDKVKLESTKESEDLYNNLIDSLKKFCAGLRSGEDAGLNLINDNLNAVIDQIALGNEEFLLLSNKPYPPEYLYTHMVNVAILSIVLAYQAGFNKSRLQDLALGAILHDIGLLEFENTISSSGEIGDKEYEQIKRHPVLGVEILEKQKGISSQALSIVLQHHECLDASGYPYGSKASKIEECAQIVGLVNFYESLTHTRPYKEKILNDQAVRSMIEKKNAFNTRFLKLFIEAISIYPLGSWVKLSSGETARVVGINRPSLLKPVVKIFFDRQGRRIEMEKTIDLSRQPNIYVKEQIPDESALAKLKA